VLLFAELLCEPRRDSASKPVMRSGENGMAMTPSATRYVVTSGIIFALITLAHLARVAVEGVRLAREPLFVLLTLGTAGLSVWAWRVAVGNRP
jgi:hypothetical protein